MKRSVVLIATIAACVGCAAPRSQPTASTRSVATTVDSAGPIDGFYPRTADSSFAGVNRYRVFIPPSYDGQRALPLVVWLHGAGGMGVDNRRQIVGDQIAGTRLWTSPRNQAAHPAFVVAPQTRGPTVNAAGQLTAEYYRILRVIAAARAEFRIDSTRMYVVGQSNGGAVAWLLLRTLTPNPFAAAVMVCPATSDTTADGVTIPVWLFHGEKDYIPVEFSRVIYRQLKAAGRSPRYTEYAGADHEIWTRAFAEPGLVDWLFGNRR